ncbi:MAG: AtpZ/AtpI family protein [Candidatus Caldatribacteriota bacterium]|nr:AtpZ/AtpI family protein [Candidatus Caldatribacteriota bacterium]
MNNKENPKDIKRSFIEKIKRKEKRKLRAKRKKGQAIWFGMGLFGVIGWSVMVPTLIGIAVGIWADRKWPGPISWTLTFLFAGIILGCLNAWYWVEKERKEIEEENKE